MGGKVSPFAVAVGQQVAATLGDPYDDLLRDARERMLQTFTPAQLEDPGQQVLEQARQLLSRMAEGYLLNLQEKGVTVAEDAESLVGRLVDDIFGFGPLARILSTETVEEIIINGTEVWVIDAERGKYKAQVAFRSPQEVINFVNRVAARQGRQLDPSHPKVDAQMSDGSRLNAVMRPIVNNVPVAVTIRRHRMVARRMEDLVRLGTLTEQAAAFLKACILGRLNVIVAGGTGTGKTNTLNAFLNVVAEDSKARFERVLVLEDTPEIDIANLPDAVSLVTREANEEGTRAVTMDDLVKNALRMRPDRIITGEARGEEIIGILNAANTGHDGQLLTLHANSALDVPERIVQMAQLARDLPERVILGWLANAFDVLVFLRRITIGDKTLRKVVQIAEIPPSRFMEGDKLPINVIFEDKGQGLRPVPGAFPQHLEETLYARSGRQVNLRQYLI